MSKEILEEIENLNWDDIDEIKNFYESHSLFFNNAPKIQDPDSLVPIINVTLRYGYALYFKSYFDKVLTVVKQADRLLENLNENHIHFETLEIHLCFLKGRTLNKVGDFKKAYPILKKLLTKDPENHDYRYWFIDTKVGLYNWLFNGILIFCCVLIVLDAILALITSVDLAIDVGALGIIIICISLIGQYGLKKYHERKTKELVNGSKNAEAEEY